MSATRNCLHFLEASVSGSKWYRKRASPEVAGLSIQQVNTKNRNLTFIGENAQSNGRRRLRRTSIPLFRSADPEDLSSRGVCFPGCDPTQTDLQARRPGGLPGWRPEMQYGGKLRTVLHSSHRPRWPSPPCRFGSRLWDAPGVQFRAPSLSRALPRASSRQVIWDN